MMFWKTSYTAVPTASEADASESLENPIRWSGKSRHLVQHLPCLIASVMALIVVGVVAFLQLSKPENVSPETCGNSSSEALSLGCSFDVISFAWLPVRCFDKELVDEFLALKDWNWYLDAGAQQTADFVSVAAGAYDELYVTQEYHMYHCTYMWRKMHRAILAGDVLDGYIGDMHHTAHCEMQILDRSRTIEILDGGWLSSECRRHKGVNTPLIGKIEDQVLGPALSAMVGCAIH